MKTIVASAFVLILAAACGSSHVRSDAEVRDADGTDAADVAVDAAVDAAPSTGPEGVLVDDCPRRAPTTGERCARTRLTCEYGDDWNPSCNTIASCWAGGPLDGTWQVQPSEDDGCPTPPDLSAGCPAVLPGGECAESDASLGLCVYGESRCVCNPFSFGPGEIMYSWQCQAGPLEDSCPARRPRIGSACTDDGRSCTYAVCGVGGGTYCTDGAWSQAINTNLCAGGMTGG